MKGFSFGFRHKYLDEECSQDGETSEDSVDQVHPVSVSNHLTPKWSF